MRGRSANPPSYRERQGSRKMRNNNNRGNTIDRERFSKFHADPDEYYEDEDIERQQGSHMSRRDKMREREREMQTPPRERQFTRYSEDRQMGGSPRYARGGRKLTFSLIFHYLMLNSQHHHAYNHSIDE